MKVFGILFAQSPDSEGETVLVDGATIKDHAIIVSANGNLLGRLDSVQIVYRCITEESISLAGRAGLSVECPQDQEENAITGINYLSLEKPFIKISATLLNNSALKAAIQAGNLYFGFHGIRKKKIDSVVESCYIDKIIVGLSTVQNCTKVFLDENTDT